MNHDALREAAARIGDGVRDLLIALTEVERVEKRDPESTSNPPPSSLLTIAEYASHAGVSRSTVNKWLRLGLPRVKSGRVVRIRPQEAAQWMRVHDETASSSTAVVQAAQAAVRRVIKVKKGGHR